HLIRGTFKVKTFFGEYIYIPYPEDRSILYHGMLDGSEVPVTEYLWCTLTKDDFFFDIGANIGFYSLLGSHLAKEVHSFEPFPETFRGLLRNKRINIVMNNIALLDKKGKFYMQEGGNPGRNRIADTGKTEVEATTLDAYCEERNVWPTVMKIDVEGSELRMLVGASQALKKAHTIVIEVIERREDIARLLETFGYREKPFWSGCKNTLFVRSV
ncbi:MAG: FkbM family methyltransferase, partial [Candidatus Kaiserbacteria bacterium]|nr:FkbM family methyltransferase [Candidatus Kaiserbacteria bacterium]